MNITAEKNRDSWDRFAAAYSEFNHSEKMLCRMQDWKYNPMAALPNWMCAIGIKN